MGGRCAARSEVPEPREARGRGDARSGPVTALTFGLIAGTAFAGKGGGGKPGGGGGGGGGGTGGTGTISLLPRSSWTRMATAARMR